MHHDTRYEPLSRKEMVSVVEGRGCAHRIPMLLHLWTSPSVFKDPGVRASVERLLTTYPMDAVVIPYKHVDIYDAPPDDPEYRWMNTSKPDNVQLYLNEQSGVKERQVALADWSQLDGILEVFPSADYPGLFPCIPADDGRYRMAHWWFTYFERHWVLRGMENALMDYYTNPHEVHRFFGALTDFYVRVMERARREVKADAIYVTDDLGTQTGPFFSPEIFDTFFAPYYRRLIETAHRLGMHFWLHCCGNVELFLPRFIELGLDVLHPIQKYAMDETRIARAYGGKIAFWVGFDVQRTIPFGTPEDVRNEVRHLFDTFFRSDGRFLFTAGNGITEDTPLKSLETLFEEAFSYGTSIVRSRTAASSLRLEGRA